MGVTRASPVPSDRLEARRVEDLSNEAVDRYLNFCETILNSGGDAGEFTHRTTAGLVIS